MIIRYRILIASLTIFFIFIFLDGVGAFKRLENLSWAWRVNSRIGAKAPSEEILILHLDQASLEWGMNTLSLDWPWPRSIYGFIIDELQSRGAASINLDLLFTEGSLPGEDDKLAEAIRGPSPVYTALITHKTSTQGRSDWPRDITPFGIPITSSDNRSRNASFPIPGISKSVSGFGDVMGNLSLDQVIQSVRPSREFADRRIPILGLAPLLNSSTWKPNSPKEEFWNPNRELILNFRGETMSHANLPFKDVLQDVIRGMNEEEKLLPSHLFKNRHVFLGFSATGLKDLRRTPVKGGLMAGVEIHATALDNALNHDFFRRTHPFYTWALGGLLALLCWAIPTLKTYRSKTFFAIIGVSASPGLGIILYAFGWWAPVATPFLIAIFSITTGLLFSSLLENEQKKFIRHAFGHYLSPEVIKKVLEKPEDLKLGGERKTLSIFFSDLAGFSSISETLDPVELTSLLNDYLGTMTDIILAHGGTLDKYEGDAIIAFWNAPLDVEDHAHQACLSAIRCEEALALKRSEYQRVYGVELYQRIGVHTGDVVVGNLGSANRFDYTVLGDAANLASRLEGANKFFASCIMISDETLKSSKTQLPFRPLAWIRVVGRKEPILVHTPIHQNDSIEKWSTWTEVLNKGYAEVQTHLIPIFDDVAIPEHERILWKHYLKQPDWKGIFTLDQK
jgi:adenylate cyclase